MNIALGEGMRISKCILKLLSAQQLDSTDLICREYKENYIKTLHMRN